MTTYKEVNGTSYHKDTNKEVINILEHARQNHIRITLNYGDIKTGRSWEEQYNINGYIGRSNGNIKIPILLYSTRSTGGSSILSHCIIGIYTSKGKKQLYKLTK